MSSENPLIKGLNPKTTRIKARFLEQNESSLVSLRIDIPGIT
jgi:hypothetical protein